MPQTHHARSRGAALAAGVAATAILLGGCSPAAPADEGPSQIRIGVWGTITVWDPAQGPYLGKDFLAANAVFESLGYWDWEAGELVPVLAESFEIADDGLAVEVVLRDDVDFTDGEHLTAEGVVKSLRYVLASDQYQLGGALAKYAPEFEVTGEYAFTISTALPVYFPKSFQFLMEMPVMSPVAIDDPDLVAAKPVGTGPYLLEEVVPEVSMTFVRNPEYRDPDTYPYDEVVLMVFSDPLAEFNALKTGQLDVATTLTAGMADEAKASGIVLHEASTTVVSLNFRDPSHSALEPLRDVRVREAMMIAFDREGIAENVYAGYAVPTVQAYRPEQAEYVDDAEDRYPYDVERARELLAEAGYPDGFDLPMATSAGTTDTLEPIVQQSLADIGIRVVYEPLPGDKYLNAIWGGDYDVLFMEENVVSSSRVLDESFPGIGRPFIPTPEVTELLGTLRGPDRDRAARAAQSLGELLLEEIWQIPLVLPTRFWASTPDVDVALGQLDGVATLRDIRPSR